MLYVCDQRFDVTENVENFCEALRCASILYAELTEAWFRCKVPGPEILLSPCTEWDTCDHNHIRGCKEFHQLHWRPTGDRRKKLGAGPNERVRVL